MADRPDRVTMPDTAGRQPGFFRRSLNPDGADNRQAETIVMDIYRFLAEHRISYDRYDHPAVFTCEQADRLAPPMPAAKTKNLLLRDKKGLRHFLVVVGYDKTVDLKALASLLEVGRLALASPERLKKHLGVDPGSVTILSVVNDPENNVEVIVDAPLWEEEALRCHPLVNTATLVISKPDVERIFQITGHSVTVIDIPAK